MELDLIEISPKAEPPVCRIADYQKFLYQQKKKAKELKANQVKVVIKEILLRSADRRPRLQLQAQARHQLPEGGLQGQGVRLLPRPFDCLQGAGRNPAAPFRHRPRRGRQSGDDAQARRQEDEHDAAPGPKPTRSSGGAVPTPARSDYIRLHNRGLRKRESDCGFLFHDRRKRQRDGGLVTHLRKTDLQACACGNELWGRTAGTNFRERARGQAFGDATSGRGLSGRGFREQTFGSATQGTALPDLFRPQKRDFAEFRNILYLCNEMITQDDIFGIADGRGVRSRCTGGIPAAGPRNAPPYREYLALDRSAGPKQVRHARRDSIACRSKSSRPTTVYCGGDGAGGGLHLVGNDGHDAVAPPDALAGAVRTDVPRSIRQRSTATPAQWSLYALLPNYLRRKGSSLVYMADRLIADCGSGGFYLDDYDGLLAAMQARPEAENPAGRKLCAVGSGGALRPEAREYGHNGDGRHEGLPRRDSQGGVPQNPVRRIRRRREIHSEYGMAELTSQAYSQGGNLFRCPPLDARHDPRRRTIRSIRSPRERAEG